jgi:phospholipid/cholesterol/gamma-HCH transport system substrate-binding protein
VPPDDRGDLRVTPPRRIGGLALGVVLLGACTLETTGAIKGEARYTSRFDDVQELVVGHTVRISDVNVGTVLDIGLDGHEAVVEFTIEDGRRIPEGTTAAIAVTSLLGENYVALELPDDPEGAPALASGATLPSSGSIATIEEVAVDLLSLTRAVRGRDAAAIIQAGATGIGPNGAALGELVDTVGAVTNGLAAQTGTFEALLTDLDVVLGSLAADAPAIGETIELAADATGSLARQRERLVAVVADLTDLAITLDAEVLVPHRARLTRIVQDLRPVVALVAGERERLVQTIEQLVVVTERLPTAINAGGITAFAWLDDFNFDGLQLQTTDLGTALRDVLLGPP